MREAVNKTLFRGFSVGSNNVDISILQYVDDTIFFGEASMVERGKFDHIEERLRAIEGGGVVTSA